MICTSLHFVTEKSSDPLSSSSAVLLQIPASFVPGISNVRLESRMHCPWMEAFSVVVFKRELDKYIWCKNHCKAVQNGPGGMNERS